MHQFFGVFKVDFGVFKLDFGVFGSFRFRGFRKSYKRRGKILLRELLHSEFLPHSALGGGARRSEQVCQTLISRWPQSVTMPQYTARYTALQKCSRVPNASEGVW